MAKKKFKDAFLIQNAAFYGIKRIPIRVLEVTQDLFPVKFEYKQRGYKGLTFSERLSNIEFCNN